MMKLLVRYKFISIPFIVTALLYVGLTIFTKPDQAKLTRYDVSRLQGVLLLCLTIVLPYLIIWSIALLGCLGLRSYVDMIRKSKDGHALALIANGLLLAAFWLPFSSLLSRITEILHSNHVQMTGNLVRIENYANALLLLVAFIILYKGAKRLLPVLKSAKYVVTSERLNLFFIGFSAIYVWLILQDPAREAPTHSVAVASYYLPDWLIVTTLLIPRLITWYLGLRAIHIMCFYKQNVSGTIYKDAFKNLAKGLAIVVVATTVVRSLQSFNTQLFKLSLAPLLILVDILLVIIAVGYLYIMHGAQRLQKIEEN